jgi:signal recognition particle subunit SRP54
MQEIAALSAALNPAETLFVVDSMQGQDAVNVAKAFNDALPLTGVVLTKLDGDARGGAALSIARVTGKPIMFASNGEALKDFDVFHPDRMASRILGMGDMLTLIEQAERTFDAEQSAKAAAKLAGHGGEFGLADFLQQMQMVRKMGPLSKVFGMLPGMGDLKDRIAGIDERDVDRIEAIIHSMTPAERDNPKIIDGSRRSRIAKGSGVDVSDVNTLINRFFEARKMMSSLATGGVPGMPGIPGLAGPRKQPARSKKKGGRGISGNPAKRNSAQQPAASIEPAAASGNGEIDQAALEKAMSEFQLPPELRSRFSK